MKKSTVKKVEAKKPVTKVTKTEEKSVDSYHLEVHVNDVVFKTDANDLREALTSFVNSPEFPFAPKTRTLIKYSKGELSRILVMPVPKARRLFSIISHKPTALEVLAIKLTHNIE